MDIAFTFNVIRVNKIFYIIKAFANKGLEIINNNNIYFELLILVKKNWEIEFAIYSIKKSKNKKDK